MSHIVSYQGCDIINLATELGQIGHGTNSVLMSVTDSGTNSHILLKWIWHLLNYYFFFLISLFTMLLVCFQVTTLSHKHIEIWLNQPFLNIVTYRDVKVWWHGKWGKNYRFNILIGILILSLHFVMRLTRFETFEKFRLVWPFLYKSGLLNIF